MSYQALYRKYRPHVFADVVGQQHVTRTLQNALREGKVAHAYLFSGPRGTGKTTVARILAATVNCLDPQNGEPCGKCDSCQSISKGSWGLIEIDGASNNSVEDIRELQARIHSIPLNARRQVYIIDEVHQLSASAFNAFLKTLEEPPAHAMFILATTEPGKLLPTVMSRCQHYPFRRITPGDIAGELRRILALEGMPYEDEAVNLIARLADGALRDAESILDQIIAFDRSKITLENCRKVLGTVDEDLLFDLGNAVVNTDSAGIVKATEAFSVSGRDFSLVLKDLTGLFRDSLIAALDEKALKVEGRSDQYISRLKTLRGKLSVDAVAKIIASLAKRTGEMRYELEKRILFETGLLELSQRLALSSKGQTASTTTVPTKPRASAVATAPLQAGILDEMEFPPEPIPLESLPMVKPPLDKKQIPDPEMPPQIDIKNPIDEWDKFLFAISRASVAKAILLSAATPLSFVNDILSVEYSQEDALIGRGISDPSLKEQIESIISGILDKQVTLEINLKRPEEKGSQAGLFEGEVNPDLAELKGIIENKVLSKVKTARLQHIERVDE